LLHRFILLPCNLPIQLTSTRDQSLPISQDPPYLKRINSNGQGIAVVEID